MAEEYKVGDIITQGSKRFSVIKVEDTDTGVNLTLLPIIPTQWKVTILVEGEEQPSVVILRAAFARSGLTRYENIKIEKVEN